MVQIWQVQKEYMTKLGNADKCACTEYSCNNRRSRSMQKRQATNKEAAHVVVRAVSTTTEPDLRLVPSVALAVGSRPYCHVGPAGPSQLDVEGVDVGAVHVVPEAEALHGGSVEGGADEACGVPIMSGWCFHVNVVVIWGRGRMRMMNVGWLLLGHLFLSLYIF